MTNFDRQANNQKRNKTEEVVLKTLTVSSDYTTSM